MTTSVTPIPATVTPEVFNTAPAAALVDRVAELFASRTLAASVVDARPFASVDALCAAASDLLRAQDDAGVLESVNAHPPIGGTVAAGSLSAAEQATAQDGAQDGDSELQALRNLQPTYREKFGWNFLIRAAGRDSRQILDNLVERLAREPQDEWPTVVDNLDAINQLRLRGFVTEADSENTKEAQA
ncbi:2-oxo-4-hydroxy-4-carboxy-5-ureidoimidazoline decarboxylase [Corynebacterium sp. AOP36-E1-14]|uniref:2-oxo-4-hydroxy-4-carboxy-5-ureidoimidazoline decarboxylase n=1 Tax=unclassified Corynebacterium TaxID=2624378 RepID=UPI003F92AACC